MGNSWNTGTAFSANTSATAAFTIPAGVNVGDLMHLGFTVFCEVNTAPAIAFSGGDGGWILPAPLHDGSNPEQQFNGTILYTYGYYYYRVATAGDPGATITLTETGSSGVTTWWAGVMGAYPGAAATQPDVAGSKGVNNALNGTSPAETTGVSGAWSLEMLLGGTGTGAPAAPGTLTTRESVKSSAGVSAILADAAASAGGAGTPIGGETWTGGNSAGNNTFTLWTISLAPAAGNITGTGAVTMAAMQVQGTGPVTGSGAVAMAAMRVQGTGAETGSNITGSGAVAMAAMRVAGTGPSAARAGLTVFVAGGAL